MLPAEDCTPPPSPPCSRPPSPQLSACQAQMCPSCSIGVRVRACHVDRPGGGCHAWQCSDCNGGEECICTIETEVSLESLEGVSDESVWTGSPSPSLPSSPPPSLLPSAPPSPPPSPPTSHTPSLPAASLPPTAPDRLPEQRAGREFLLMDPAILERADKEAWYYQGVPLTLALACTRTRAHMCTPPPPTPPAHPMVSISMVGNEAGGVHARTRAHAHT